MISPLVGVGQGYNRDTFSSVLVNKDPRFDEMSAKQAEINRRSVASGPRRVNGFRIQAINTQNRDEANAVKAELLHRFPDQKSYLLYQAPSFRVRLGNFLTQKEASQLRKMISALYPGRGIYIVPDIVEYMPPLNEDDTKN
ncbi:MAG: SPOR domain-containing protein [Segetibacter sp.]